MPWEFGIIVKVQVLSTTRTRSWKLVILAIFMASTCQDLVWMSKKSCRKIIENPKTFHFFFPMYLFHPKKSSKENCCFSSVSTTFQAHFYCSSSFKSSYSAVVSPVLFDTALNLLRQQLSKKEKKVLLND